MIEARVFCSTHPGPHLLMLGGVHGDEPCGTVALHRLGQELAGGVLPLVRGRVTMVPVANPAARELGRRYLEANLNRVMCEHENPHHYEQRVANTICSHIRGVDALLDLHAVTAPSPPFTFLDQDTPVIRAWIAALGVPYVLSGWDRLYPGAGASNSTASYASGLGKPAIGVECGQKTDPASADVAYVMARLTLAHFGLTAPFDVARPGGSPRFLRMTEVVWKEQPGELLEDFANFAPVRAGQPLARQADGSILSAAGDGYIVMPKASAETGEEWYYLAVAA